MKKCKFLTKSDIFKDALKRGVARCQLLTTSPMLHVNRCMNKNDEVHRLVLILMRPFLVGSHHSTVGTPNRESVVEIPPTGKLSKTNFQEKDRC